MSQAEIQKNKVPSSGPTGARSGNAEQNGVRVNGYNQILEMLQFADPTFRESLLRRLANQDPQLAKNLRQALSKHT